MATLQKSENKSTGGNYVPRGTYQLRVKEEPKVAKSKKGNPMLVFTFEIVQPQVVVVDGKESDISGIEVPCWATLPPAATFTLEQLHEAMELPFGGVELGEDGRPQGIEYAGREFWGILKTEKADQKREGTDEVLLNPLTGQPLQSDRVTFEKPITKNS